MEKMLGTLKSKAAALAAVTASALLATPAFAQTADMDVSGVTTFITAAGVAVGTIGAAVLVVIFGAKAWKWVRSAG